MNPAACARSLAFLLILGMLSGCRTTSWARPAWLGGGRLPSQSEPDVEFSQRAPEEKEPVVTANADPDSDDELGEMPDSIGDGPPAEEGPRNTAAKSAPGKKSGNVLTRWLRPGAAPQQRIALPRTDLDEEEENGEPEDGAFSF